MYYTSNKTSIVLVRDDGQGAVTVTTEHPYFNTIKTALEDRSASSLQEDELFSLATAIDRVEVQVTVQNNVLELDIPIFPQSQAPDKQTDRTQGERVKYRDPGSGISLSYVISPSVQYEQDYTAAFWEAADQAETKDKVTDTDYVPYLISLSKILAKGTTTGVPFLASFFSEARAKVDAFFKEHLEQEETLTVVEDEEGDILFTGDFNEALEFFLIASEEEAAGRTDEEETPSQDTEEPKAFNESVLRGKVEDVLRQADDLRKLLFAGNFEEDEEEPAGRHDEEETSPQETEDTRTFKEQILSGNFEDVLRQADEIGKILFRGNFAESLRKSEERQDEVLFNGNFEDSLRKSEERQGKILFTGNFEDSLRKSEEQQGKILFTGNFEEGLNAASRLYEEEPAGRHDEEELPYDYANDLTEEGANECCRICSSDEDQASLRTWADELDSDRLLRPSDRERWFDTLEDAALGKFDAETSKDSEEPSKSEPEDFEVLFTGDFESMLNTTKGLIKDRLSRLQEEIRDDVESGGGTLPKWFVSLNSIFRD